jgi:hypothetical protein
MKHRFERVINGSDKQKKDANEGAQQAYELGWSDDEALLDREVPLTLFHRFLIKDLREFAETFIESLGLSKDIPTPRLVVLEKGATHDLNKGRIRGGYDDPRRGYIAADDSDSKAVFASRFAHEYFHSLGYGSLQIIGDEPDDEIHPYRSGISMHDRKDPNKRYFDLAEEALAADFAQQYLLSVAQKDEEISSEIRSRNVIVDWFRNSEVFKRGYPEEKYADFLRHLANFKALPDAEDVVSVLQDASKDDGYKIGYAFGYLKERFRDYNEYSGERLIERESFDGLIERIVAASSSTATTEEVKNAFYNAHFTGNYLPLARLIESALGPGSFREVAELLSSKESTKKD